MVKLDQKGYERALQISTFCVNMRKSEWTEVQFNFVNPVCLCFSLLRDSKQYDFGSGDIYCGEIFERIASASITKKANFGSGELGEHCLIFDEDVFKNGPRESADFNRFCGVSSKLISNHRTEPCQRNALTKHRSLAAFRLVSLFSTHMNSQSQI